MKFATPTGFRDVLPDEAAQREAIIRRVQEAFAQKGYRPLETPTLEAMDVMSAGGRLPGSPFKFFDSQGDLLAMRPDVTLQVARMVATRLSNEEGPFRFRYTQRVFRETEAQGQAAAREMTQMGVECVGESGPCADAEIVSLFADALKLAGVDNATIALASVGVVRALLDKCGGAAWWKEAVLNAYHASNFVELDRLTSPDGHIPSDEIQRALRFQEDVIVLVPEVYRVALRDLSRIRGGKEAIERVRTLVAPLACEDGLDDLEKTFDYLAKDGYEDHLLVDFSVMSSFDYYTGIVFEAYAPGVGSPLGSGGRYDNMIAVYGQSNPAAGFAFYLEQAMAAASYAGSKGDVKPLRIAVPKGSLNGDTIAALQAAGLDVTGLDKPGRQLIIRNPGVEYVIVRPTDAPMFVALGAADCGVCGKDSLLEAALDVVELTDLEFGACRFVVAEPAGATASILQHERELGSIRVATKYPRITQSHYAHTATQVEIVKLHGNIELAPLTGMAERIVDITATGTTLRENDLVIVDEVLASTARFFANECAFRTDKRIVELAQKLSPDVSGD